MEVPCLLSSQVFRLDVFEWVERDQEIAVCRLSLQQLFLHLPTFLEVGSILLEDALFDGLDLRLDITKFLGVQCCMLGLFLTLDLLLLSCQGFSLFGHFLQVNLAGLEALLELPLLCLLLADYSHTEVQSGAV